MESQKVFNETVKSIRSQFGEQAIVDFNSKEKKNISVIKTGSLNLDNILGINGFPRGRIIEIYGNESCGKTTLALQAIASCQKNHNGKCAFIDTEHALDAKYCESNGVDINKMLIAQPESGEQTFAIIEALAKTGIIDLIVVDSVAAIVPESEINGEYEDQHVGLHARLMSKGLRIIQSVCYQNNVTIIFINQIREKIGVLFGDNKTTTGGWALKFFSSIRIELKRSELIRNSSKSVIGIRTQARVVKNKLAPPMQTTYLDIYFDRGFDNTFEIIDMAITKKVIVQKGSWFFYNNIQLVQGRDNLKAYFEQPKNQKIFNDIKKIIFQ